MPELGAEGRDSKKQPFEIYANNLARLQTNYWRTLSTSGATTTTNMGRPANEPATWDEGVPNRPLRLVEVTAGAGGSGGGGGSTPAGVPAASVTPSSAVLAETNTFPWGWVALGVVVLVYTMGRK